MHRDGERGGAAAQRAARHDGVEPGGGEKRIAQGARNVWTVRRHRAGREHPVALQHLHAVDAGPAFRRGVHRPAADVERRSGTGGCATGGLVDEALQGIVALRTRTGRPIGTGKALGGNGWNVDKKCKSGGQEPGQHRAHESAGYVKRNPRIT